MFYSKASCLSARVWPVVVFFLLFAADSPLTARAQEATLIEDLYPGSGSVGPYGSEPSSFVSYGEKLYFTATTPEYGRQWMRYDPGNGGTGETVELAVDLAEQADRPSRGVVHEEKLYFVAYADRSNDNSLWRFDAATGEVEEVSREVFDIDALHSFAGKLFLVARSSAGRELHVYDSATDEISVVADLDPNFLTSFATNVSSGASYMLHEVNDELCFGASFSSNSESVAGIYCYDPDEASVELRIDTDALGVAVASLAVFGAEGDSQGQRLYFTNPRLTDSFELWRADPQSGSAAVVATGEQHGLRYTHAPHLTVVSGGLVFEADKYGDGHTSVWVYEEGGGILPVLPETGYDYVSPQGEGFIEHDGRVFFSGGTPPDGDDPYGDVELWSLDVATGEARREADINPGQSRGYPENFFSWQGALFFSAAEESVGEELWRFGRPAGGTPPPPALDPTYEDAILRAPDLAQEGRFGSAIAVSGPNMFVSAAGVYGDSGEWFDRGVVYAYERGEDGSWQYVQTLRSSEPASFGGDVLLNGDRGFIKAQRRSTEGDIVVLHVFERDDDGQWQEVQVLHPADVASTPTDADFSISPLALDGDDVFLRVLTNDLISGDPALDAVYVLERNEEGVWQKKQELDLFSDVPPPAPINGFLTDQIGVSVAVQGERALAAVGRISSGSRLWALERDAEGLWQRTQEVESTPAETIMGGVVIDGARAVRGLASIERSPDGDIRDVETAVRVFEFGADGLWQGGQTLADPDADEEYRQFGTHMALRSSRLLVSAREDEDGGSGARGSVYVYERTPEGVWQLVKRLRSSNQEDRNSLGRALALTPRTALVGAHNADGPAGEDDPGAVYVYDLGSLATPVEDAPGAPQAFALHGNYPNPFSAVTTLCYELPRAARVRLDVFDVMGRRVAVLADAPMPAGVHEARFDAATFPAGVYFARVQAGSEVVVRRMVRVR